MRNTYVVRERESARYSMRDIERRMFHEEHTHLYMYIYIYSQPDIQWGTWRDGYLMWDIYIVSPIFNEGHMYIYICRESAWYSIRDIQRRIFNEEHVYAYIYIVSPMFNEGHGETDVEWGTYIYSQPDMQWGTHIYSQPDVQWGTWRDECWMRDIYIYTYRVGPIFNEGHYETSLVECPLLNIGPTLYVYIYMSLIESARSQRP